MPAKNEIEILVTAEVDRALKNINKLDNKTTKTTKGLGSKLAKLKAGWIALGGAIGITVVKGFKALISIASDAQETFSKFDTVFKDVAKSSAKVAKDFARDFGLSDLAAKKLLGTTGDILSGFEFTGKAALSLSKNVNELAVDLGSFQNISTERASSALTKALTGETESLKLLGIVIRQDTKEFKDNVAAIQESQGVSLQQAKSLEILRQATIQSKNAVGDFARTQKQFANQTKVLQKNIENLAVFLGLKLLPAATRVINAINNAVEPIKNFIKKVKELNAEFSVGFRILTLYANAWRIIGNIILIAITPIRAAISLMKILGKSVLSLIKAFSSGKGIAGAFKDFIKTIKESAIQARKDLVNPFKKIGESSKNLVNGLKNGNKEIEKSNDELTDKIISNGEKVVKAQTATAKELKALQEFLTTDELSELEKLENQKNNLIKQFGKQRLAIEQAASIRRRALKAQEAADTIRLIADTEKQISDVVGQFIEGAIARDEQEKNRKLSELDTQLQAELEAKGLADLTEIEQAQLRLEELLAIDTTEFTEKEKSLNEKKIAQAEDAVERAKIEKGYADKKEKVEQDAAIKTAKNRRKLAVLEKTASLFSIGASIAESIAKSVSASFLTGGLPFSAINAGIGVAQAAAVIANPLPEIPAFAGGTSSAPGGLSLVGEKGAELVNLPRSSQVKTAAQTKSIINNQNKNTSLAGANIYVTANNPAEMVEQIEGELNGMGSSLF